MKHISISLMPSANVVFDSEEIALLLECSANHYDGVCKDAGRSRSDGAPINGIIRIIESRHQFDPARSHELSWRDLDTLAKILEVGHYMGEDKGSRAVSLGVSIRQALIRLNDAASTIIVA